MEDDKKIKIIEEEQVRKLLTPYTGKMYKHYETDPHGSGTG